MKPHEERELGFQEREDRCSALASGSRTKPWLFLRHNRQTHPAQGTWHCLWPHSGRPGDGSDIGVDAEVPTGWAEAGRGFTCTQRHVGPLQTCFLTLWSRAQLHLTGT